MQEGIVIINENGYFTVQDNSGRRYTTKVRGRLKQNRYRILVGDRIKFKTVNEKEGWIEEVLPRKNALRRPPVSNIDQVLLVVAAHHPDINNLLLNKLLVMIEDEDIPVVLCINKWDLADEESEALVELYRKAGYTVLCTSTWEDCGLVELRETLSGHVTALAGPSGVGKSSLLNAIDAGFTFQTGTISDKTKRGRHTTRHASLYALDDDSFIMDTPGFSALDFTDLTETRLSSLFPEFLRYEEGCKFSPCSHVHEPICGIKEALARGDVDPSRYEAYLAIRSEILQAHKK